MGAASNTVMILINATTLIIKSILSTINFGNIHFRQKYRNKIFVEISEDYNGVCLKKNFQRMEQKLENAFLAKFSIF